MCAISNQGKGKGPKHDTAVCTYTVVSIPDHPPPQHSVLFLRPERTQRWSGIETRGEGGGGDDVASTPSEPGFKSIGDDGIKRLKRAAHIQIHTQYF